MSLFVSNIVEGSNEQNNIVNKFSTYDWTAERAIIASNTLCPRDSEFLKWNRRRNQSDAVKVTVVHFTGILTLHINKSQMTEIVSLNCIQCRNTLKFVRGFEHLLISIKS